MNCNIWKSYANQHIYLHLQKHTIKKKPQMFLSSFGCNALLIQEYNSICTRGKYICLAPAVILQPGRTKQRTPQIYFSDAQKEQDCNPDQNSCSLSMREKAPGCDLSHAGYTCSSFPGGCTLRAEWCNHERVWDWALVSVGKLCFCPRMSTLQKHQPGSLVIAFLI